MPCESLPLRIRCPWDRQGTKGGLRCGVSCPGLPGTSAARSGLSSLSVSADVLRVSVACQVQYSAQGAQFMGLMSPGLAFCPKFMGTSQGWAPGGLLMLPCQWQGRKEYNL